MSSIFEDMLANAQKNIGCINCGCDLPQDAKFCNQCGSKQVKNCSNCSEEIDVNDLFCVHCGEKIKTANAAIIKTNAEDSNLNNFECRELVYTIFEYKIANFASLSLSKLKEIWEEALNNESIAVPLYEGSELESYEFEFIDNDLYAEPDLIYIVPHYFYNSSSYSITNPIDINWKMKAIDIIDGLIPGRPLEFATNGNEQAFFESTESSDGGDYVVSVFLGDTLIGEYDLYELDNSVMEKILSLAGDSDASGAKENLEMDITNILKKYGPLIDDSKLYYDDKIPSKKLNNAIGSYVIDWAENEKALALFDDTIFGSAKDGFLLSTEAIYCKNLSEKQWKLTFNEIENVMVDDDKDEIVLNDYFRIKITPMNKKQSIAIMVKIINEIKGF